MPLPSSAYIVSVQKQVIDSGSGHSVIRGDTTCLNVYSKKLDSVTSETSVPRLNNKFLLTHCIRKIRYKFKKRSSLNFVKKKIVLFSKDRTFLKQK